MIKVSFSSLFFKFFKLLRYISCRFGFKGTYSIVYLSHGESKSCFLLLLQPYAKQESSNHKIGVSCFAELGDVEPLFVESSIGMSFEVILWYKRSFRLPLWQEWCHRRQFFLPTLLSRTYLPPYGQPHGAKDARRRRDQTLPLPAVPTLPG